MQISDVEATEVLEGSERLHRDSCEADEILRCDAAVEGLHEDDKKTVKHYVEEESGIVEEGDLLDTIRKIRQRAARGAAAAAGGRGGAGSGASRKTTFVNHDVYKEDDVYEYLPQTVPVDVKKDTDYGRWRCWYGKKLKAKSGSSGLRWSTSHSWGPSGRDGPCIREMIEAVWERRRFRSYRV